LVPRWALGTSGKRGDDDFLPAALPFGRIYLLGAPGRYAHKDKISASIAPPALREFAVLFHLPTMSFIVHGIPDPKLSCD
jgi:hypothetical protein